MRSVSLSFRKKNTDEHSGTVLVLLLTIIHDALVDLGYPNGKLRLSSDPTERFSETPLRYGTTSRGNEYEFLPFSWRLWEDSEDTPPDMPLSIANFSPELTALLRSVSEPAEVKAELVTAADPDTVEIEAPEFDLVSVTYNDETVDLDLSIDSLTGEEVPAGSYTPATHPGLF